MSQCEDHEGPLTTVEGTISDAKTNDVYGNITLQITRKRARITNQFYDDFDTVVTTTNGKYKLTFTPILPGTFTIYYKDYDIRKYDLKDFYTSGFNNELVIGKTNTVDFKVSKLINLKINLKNSSNYNFTRFQLSSNENSIFYQSTNSAITKDTILNYKIPRLTPIYITSTFYDIANSTNSKKLENQFNIASSDTTIFINN